mmetsp:Transcript_9998/g.7521  ORF Transcript_9998/g.7521 Transcript_9998/m.7521 type:complete len:149 (+) Transcript_9998:761-1207(+)
MMKKLRKDHLLKKNRIQSLKIERRLLGSTNHPYFARVEHCFQDEKRIYLIKEFLKGGDLLENLFKVKRFTEEQARFISAQVILAIGYLHQQEIVFRDLRAENIYLDENGYIKIENMEFARVLKRQDRSTSPMPSNEYTPPEQVRGDPY